MNIEFMRFIDRCVGSLVCFIFSFINSLHSLFSKKQISIKKILFIELSEMGSTILGFPMFMEVKSGYPDADLHFLTFHKNRCAVDILSFFRTENIWTLNNDTLCSFLLNTIKLVKIYRKIGVDTVIIMEPFSRFTVIFSKLCGINRIVGFTAHNMEGLYMGNLLTHPVPFNSSIHMKDNYIALFRSLSITDISSFYIKQPVSNVDNFIPLWKTSKDSLDSIRQKLKKYHHTFNNNYKIILLKVGGGLLPTRKWPLDNFIALAKKMLSSENICICIVGLEEDEHDAKIIKEILNTSLCINLTGKTSINELMDLFNLADLLITNDGGPAHFASMTTIPSIVFFGPETPALFKPLSKNCYPLYSKFYCSPCLSVFNKRKTDCMDNVCIKNIQVETVFELALDILSKNS